VYARRKNTKKWQAIFLGITKKVRDDEWYNSGANAPSVPLSRACVLVCESRILWCKKLLGSKLCLKGLDKNTFSLRETPSFEKQKFEKRKEGFGDILMGAMS
jgi:hypothetical protein